MDWSTSNPVTSSAVAEAANAASSALSSIGESASGFYNSTVVTSALSSIGDAQFFEESISPTTVREQLSVTGDPSNPSTTLNLIKGMKWLLANMSKGRNVSDFFPYVVKLVGAPNLEVRKMVYIYLARYSNHDSQCREMALLSINAFQRGLADREPLFRSLALRVLTSMDVPDVLQLQILGVQTCSKDSSPYVRKCAANAVAKLHPRCLEVGDAVQAEQLVMIMTKLLDDDESTMVLTSAMTTFCEICPHKLELLHGCYRKLCHLLTDMDEWGQIIVMDALTRYCRTYFKQPRGQKKGSAEKIDQERRVTRIMRNAGSYAINGDKLAIENGNNDNDADSLFTSIIADAVPAANGLSSSSPPLRNVVREKRRVVRKAFYSDEEDESSEEEVPKHYLSSDGNVAGTLREQSVLNVPSASSIGMKNIGFRDVINTANTTSEDAFFAQSNGAPSTFSGLGDTNFEDDEDSDLNEDHKALLNSSFLLLKSRNSGVVLAVCSLHYYCGIASIKIRTALGKALVRIHRDRREIQYVVLLSIRTLVQDCPSAFTPFLHEFFVKVMDPSFTRMIKLDILVSLCIDPTAIDVVLSELRTYVRHNDKSFVCAAIRTVGKVVELARVVYDRRSLTTGLDASLARADANAVALNCLSGLVTLSEFSKNSMVVGECAETIQRIISQLWSNDEESVVPDVKDPAKVQERALKRLFLILIRALASDQENVNDNNCALEQLTCKTVRVPVSSIASTLWLIGEWSSMPRTVTSSWDMNHKDKDKIRFEVLRLLTKSFVDFDSETKLQAVHMASKVLLMLTADQTLSDASDKEKCLCETIIAMGRVDIFQDVRDRSRYESDVLQMCNSLSNDATTTHSIPESSRLVNITKAKTMLLNRKPMASSLPLDRTEFDDAKVESDLFRFGTLSGILGYRTCHLNPSLPRWADDDSPSSLRDSSQVKHESEERRGDGIVGSIATSYDDASSSDTSSSSSDGSSSDDDSSSRSDSSEESENETARGIQSSNDMNKVANDTFRNRGVFNPPSTSNLKSGTPKSSLLTEEDSSSPDSYSDDSSESDSSDEEKIGFDAQEKPRDMEILDMDSFPPDANVPKSRSSTSVVASGLEDLVMSPLVFNNEEADQSLYVNNDSSAWKELVRPELCGGLFVKFRFLRGSSRIKQAQIMALDPDNPSTICVQMHIENMRTDAGSLRHIRIIHRVGTSCGIISPSKVVSPPELLALKKGKQSHVFLGLTFASATDRDGISVVKLDIKTDRGTTLVEIRPTLGELLDSLNTKFVSQSEFDNIVSNMNSIHQRVVSSFSLPTVNDTVFDNIPNAILQHLNLKQIGVWSGKGRFIGTLPTSKHTVYIVVECDSANGIVKTIVCCDDAIASNNLSNLLKQSISNAK